jgi:hypothetical protein
VFGSRKDYEKLLMRNQVKKASLKKWKRTLTVVTLILPFLYTAFIITDRYGLWDELSGLDLVEGVSARFDLSYADNASLPVRVGDREWWPLLKIIRNYSGVKLRADKEPRVIARFRASFSTRTPREGPIYSEWTAPSTPIAVIYQDWPTNSGKGVPQQQWQIIGTIGDLKDWIAKVKDSRRFLVEDIFLGTFGPALAILIFLLEAKLDSWLASCSRRERGLRWSALKYEQAIVREQGDEARRRRDQREMPGWCPALQSGEEKRASEGRLKLRERRQGAEGPKSARSFLGG